MIGIDLFAGAGGMSIGAEMSGINVKYAVELDSHAAKTYSLNHRQTTLLQQDIRTVDASNFHNLNSQNGIVIFGGPPCQGFSTSNQTTRNKTNTHNWLFKDYLRIVSQVMPDVVVFENVKGLLETEGGYFLEAILNDFKALGYTTSHFVLNSADFGVPQKRNRLFIVANLHGVYVSPPKATSNIPITVKQALEDLPDIENGNQQCTLQYSSPAKSEYAQVMRGSLDKCTNNLVTRNANHIIERYKHIPQGGNWENIPKALMGNYADTSRCHTGIYRRLKESEPSVVIGNYRKNMLIHPWKDRGLSVREASRLQSVPDNFIFSGSVGFQQQQVGNLVPPLMAKALFDTIKC